MEVGGCTQSQSPAERARLVPQPRGRGQYCTTDSLREQSVVGGLRYVPLTPPGTI